MEKISGKKSKHKKNDSLLNNEGLILAFSNAGFNIYRSRNKNENYTKVNSTLIPAEGNSTIGAVYSFKDTPGNGTFYYKLEDIDNKGVSTMHRQVIVKVKK